MMSRRKSSQFKETSDIFPMDFLRLGRTVLLESRGVTSRVIRYAVLPTPEQNTDPFKRQGSYSSVVRLFSFALPVVKALGPGRFPSREPSPFVKCLT